MDGSGSDAPQGQQGQMQPPAAATAAATAVVLGPRLLSGSMCQEIALFVKVTELNLGNGTALQCNAMQLMFVAIDIERRTDTNWHTFIHTSPIHATLALPQLLLCSTKLERSALGGFAR
jgi:hypothetical protein